MCLVTSVCSSAHPCFGTFIELKSNCVQEPTDGKHFQFLIPCFGHRKHCHRYKLAHGLLCAGYTKSHIWDWVKACWVLETLVLKFNASSFCFPSCGSSMRVVHSSMDWPIEYGFRCFTFATLAFQAYKKLPAAHLSPSSPIWIIANSVSYFIKTVSLKFSLSFPFHSQWW